MYNIQTFCIDISCYISVYTCGHLPLCLSLVRSSSLDSCRCPTMQGLAIASSLHSPSSETSGSFHRCGRCLLGAFGSMEILHEGSEQVEVGLQFRITRWAFECRLRGLVTCVNAASGCPLLLPLDCCTCVTREHHQQQQQIQQIQITRMIRIIIIIIRRRMIIMIIIINMVSGAC